MSDGHLELQTFLAAAQAPATTRAYRADLADFTAWATAAGCPGLPAEPELIARYLAVRAATLKPATLERRLAALAHYHRQAGHPLDLRHPLIVGVRAGIRRSLGTAQAGKRPLTVEDVRAIVAIIPSDLAGLRDRCALTVGFAGGLRRSELSGLDIGDLRPVPDGLALCLRRSKTDPEGQSTLVAIPHGQMSATCPVRATIAWLQRMRAADGPLLRPVDQSGRLGTGRLSGAAIAAMVKRRVAAAIARGVLDVTAAEADAFVAAVSGHSLRSGAITTVARTSSLWEVLDFGRHARVETARKYIKRGTLFERDLGGRIGL